HEHCSSAQATAAQAIAKEDPKTNLRSEPRIVAHDARAQMFLSCWRTNERSAESHRTGCSASRPRRVAEQSARLEVFRRKARRATRPRHREHHRAWAASDRGA